MPIAQEEIFGPVLSIMAFDTEGEVIAIATGADYGLAASLWTNNLGLAHRVADLFDAGYISVNY